MVMAMDSVVKVMRMTEVCIFKIFMAFYLNGDVSVYVVNNMCILIIIISKCDSLLADNSKSRIHVSAREYYCYIMQIRDDVFNIFFYGGRLFQQWIVDVFIKIESMRLDWYSKPEHQKIIRADLYQVLTIGTILVFHYYKK